MRWNASAPGLACIVFLARSAAAAESAPGSDSGGGGYTHLPTDAMSDAERAAIQAQIDANVARLTRDGRLPAPSAAGVLLGWPLRFAPGFAGPSDFGYHGISNFIDEDPAFPGQILDYNCGARSYDLSSGYNHRGTDIFTWPFPWNRVDSDAVEVVSGADGVIVNKSDGNVDRNCAMSGSNWNAVFVRHGDGSTAWYGHMKNGSLTSKIVGDAVLAGERLGVVASSGSSTGPHLHFELYDGTGALIDPWQGSCNSMNPDSWWAAQAPYHDSAINKLMTGSAAAVLASCPAPDTSNEARVFAPGDTIWFTRFYRDQLLAQQSECTIYRPDLTPFQSWIGTSNAPHYAASWWWNSFVFDASVPTGRWLFEVRYEQRTYEHEFWILAPGPWLLRNAQLTSIAPPSDPLSGIFTGTGGNSLDALGLDQFAGPGEGDDDDSYLRGATSGMEDPETAVVSDATRPLVFYQVSDITTSLLAVKTAAGRLALSW